MKIHLLGERGGDNEVGPGNPCRHCWQNKPARTKVLSKSISKIISHLDPFQKVFLSKLGTDVGYWVFPIVLQPYSKIGTVKEMVLGCC